HGCSQLVWSRYGLSAATSATAVCSCQHVKVGTLNRLPAQAERKAGTTPRHHGPHGRGYTRATMDGTAGSYTAMCCQSRKAIHSSDQGLQLDPVKLDSLVIAYQQ